MKINNRRGPQEWYAVNPIQNKAGATEAVDIYIYGEIGDYWGDDATSASQFVREVAALDVSKINLHVNSPGGDAFDAISIANSLRQHKARVEVTVDGLAASAASFIAIAGDELIMAPHSELMIHDAWGLCMGNAADMTKLAERLNRTSDNVAAMYAAKGGTEYDWRAAMREETWFTAEEAVEVGLADRVGAEPDAEATEIKNKFDLSIFAHAGRSEAPAPKLRRRATPVINGSTTYTGSSTTPVINIGGPVTTSTTTGVITLTPSQASLAEPVRTNNPNMEGADLMSDTLTSGLRERLGVSADTDLDEAGLLAALDEALAEQAEESPQNKAPSLPQGIVAVEEATLNSLRRDAELGRQAREQQLADQRLTSVNAAINDGRIAPSRKDHWIAALAADPGSISVLDSLAPGTVPIQATGYTGGVEESSDDEGEHLYTRMFGKDVA